MLALLNLEQEKIFALFLLGGALAALILIAMFWLRRHRHPVWTSTAEKETLKTLERLNEPPVTSAESHDSALRRAKALERENARLRELAKIKDEFLRIVSHELRTPMDVIRGNLDMVLKGDAGEIGQQAQAYIKDSLESADRLTKLVNDMLDTSRIETGRLRFNLQKADITGMIHHVVSDLQILAEKKNIKLVFVPPKKTVPAVLTDAERITQVLDNLIGNAVKFTPKGSVEVSVRKEGETAVVSVKDTGIGIREEDRHKLFKRFPEIDNSGVGGRGSGLGLYIASEILAKMGGRIWVESKGRGKGSTFSFALPLYKDSSGV